MQTSNSMRIPIRMQPPPNAYTLALTLLLGIVALFGCKKNDQPVPKDVDLKLVADGMTSPITLLESPDGTHRLFVVDQVGQVWILNANGQRMSQPFIDVSSKMVPLMPGYDERGLLGMAFHPNYKSNGKFYLFYTAPPPPGGPSTDAGNTGLPKTWNNTTRIAEFQVSSSDPNRANINSERVILEEPHPQFNHNGGTIAFGPDGYLYISIGDGGNKNDIGPGHVEDWYRVNAGGNGQDVEQNLMGNVLRIDVNGNSEGGHYGIPADNPFVGKPGRDEIYAYGFRNPYRFSFDMGGSHWLFLGDAGQNLWEEIDVVAKGGNYGWNVKEGTHCFNADSELLGRPDCPDKDSAGNPLIDPVIEMKNLDNPSGGQTLVVVGGNVYRGNTIPGLQGKYVFGSLSADEKKPEGQVFVSIPRNGSGLWKFDQLELKSYPGNIGYWLKGFGQDLSGEVYVLATKTLGPSGSTGKVFKLVTAGSKY